MNETRLSATAFSSGGVCWLDPFLDASRGVPQLTGSFRYAGLLGSRLPAILLPVGSLCAWIEPGWMCTVAEDIFISYSRQDATFVEQLRDALTNRGRSVWLDTSNIAPTSVWRQEIISAIDAASAVLFVISPSWLASEVSQRELNYAIEMHKKLVPVLYRDVDHRLVNPALAEINWVLARSGDNPQIALNNILFAIDTDLQYWKQGGDLQAKAAQWNERKRQPAYTLRGEALRRAEQWLAEGASKKPAPSTLQVEYVTAGRRAAAARQRTTIGALSAGIIITLILSIVASFLAETTQRQNVLLTAQIRQLGGEATANNAFSEYNGDQPGLSVLLAAAAYKVGKPGDPATRKALFSLVHQSPHLDSILLDSSSASYFDAASYIGYSADGNTEAFVRQSVVTIDFTSSSQPQVNFSPPPAPGLVSPNILGGALSSDGRLVAVKVEDISDGSHITLWSATTGKQVGQLDGLTYESQTQQHDMAFSPDGRFLASAICPDSACNTTQFTIWNVKTGRTVAQVPGLYSLGLGSTFGSSVSFSHDSRYVAFNDNKNVDEFATPSRVVVYDLQQGAVSYILNSPTQISALAFSPSPQILAVSSIAGSQGVVQQVTFWNVVTQAQVGQVTTINDVNPIETIEFSSKLYWMLTADTIHTVNMWGVDPTFSTSPFTENVVSVRAYLTAIALSPDGNLVTTSSEDGQIIVWRLSPFTSSSPDAELTYGADAALAFSSDNQWLVYSNFTSINSWNVVDGKPGVSIANLPGSVTQLLAVSHDGSLVAAAEYIGSSTSSKLMIFNRATGKMQGSPWTTPIYNFNSLQFSPDGRTLLACGITYVGASQCVLWDTQSHTLVQSFGQAGGGQSQGLEFFTGSFSPDGTSIGFGVVDSTASSSNGAISEIEVYSIGAQRVTATLNLGLGIPLATTWSPNSKYVGYLDTAGNIKIWNPTTNARPIEVTKVPSAVQPTLQFVAPPPVADSTSLWIMATTEASLELWQIDSNGHSSQYLDPLFFESLIYSSASSPNGKYLAIGENAIGLVSVLSLDPNDWIKQACNIAGRNLTRPEWQKYVQAHFASVTVPYETLCPGLQTYLS
jgi:TIR domain/WD domain, G-beta repeat